MIVTFIFSFDIEKQEVIELPLEIEMESIQFMNDNYHHLPELPSTFKGDASKGVTQESYSPQETQIDNESSSPVAESAQETATEDSASEANTDILDARFDQIPNDDQIDK